MLINIHKKTIAWKWTYLETFLKNVPIPRLFIFIEKSMTYQKKIFFRVITFHNINYLKRKVSGEYFNKINYKKNSILQNWKSDGKGPVYSGPFVAIRLCTC